MCKTNWLVLHVFIKNNIIMSVQPLLCYAAHTVLICFSHLYLQYI